MRARFLCIFHFQHRKFFFFFWCDRSSPHNQCLSLPMIVHECAFYHVVLVRVATTTRDLPQSDFSGLERPRCSKNETHADWARAGESRIPEGIPQTDVESFETQRVSAAPTIFQSQSKSCCGVCLACGETSVSLAVSQRKEGLSWWSFGEVTNAYASVGDVWNIGSVGACCGKVILSRAFFFLAKVRHGFVEEGLSPRRSTELLWKAEGAARSWHRTSSAALAPATSEVLGQWRLKLRLSACLATWHPSCWHSVLFAKALRKATRLREEEGLSAMTLY